MTATERELEHMVDGMEPKSPDLYSQGFSPLSYPLSSWLPVLT